MIDLVGAVLQVIYPWCPCSHGACGDRIPVFEWAGGVKPSAADMRALADDIAQAVFAAEGG